jgi:hypothetical protein
MCEIRGNDLELLRDWRRAWHHPQGAMGAARFAIPAAVLVVFIVVVDQLRPIDIEEERHQTG